MDAARVVKADVGANNGVIHVIDTDPSENGQVRPLRHRQGRDGVEIEN